MGRVSQPKHYLINRNEGIMCYVTSAENNWFSIDFKNIRIKPSNYTLRYMVRYIYMLKRLNINRSKYTDMMLVNRMRII